MARDDTVVLSIRVKAPLAEALHARAGGKEHFTEWLHALLATAAAGRAPGAGALQMQGYEAGKRQGWARANQVFREALQRAAEELKK